jgi:hypothetical protein
VIVSNLGSQDLQKLRKTPERLQLPAMKLNIPNLGSKYGIIHWSTKSPIF